MVAKRMTVRPPRLLNGSLGFAAGTHGAVMFHASGPIGRWQKVMGKFAGSAKRRSCGQNLIMADPQDAGDKNCCIRVEHHYVVVPVYL